MWLRGTCMCTTLDIAAPNTWTLPPNVLLPVCSFGFLLPASMCDTNSKNERQSNSVLNPHKGATLCSICNWAHREDDDSDENDSATKPDWGSQLPGSDTGCSDTKTMIWLPLFYRWGNHNLEKLRVLSNVTQLIGCIVWLYLIKCPKDTWTKWSLWYQFKCTDHGSTFLHSNSTQYM